MANEIKGHAVGLYYSATNDPYDWQLVACLTDKSFNGTTDTIEVNSDCEAGNTRLLPGNKSWTFEITGYINTSPGPGQVSNETLFDLWNNTSDVNFAVGYFKMTDNAGYTRIGPGFVSSFSESGTSNEFMTFTATISNSGAISDVELS